jgi:hypothetical protein
MPTELAHTEADKRRSREIDRDWHFAQQVPSFSGSSAETKRTAIIIRFRSNKFRLSDDETERWLRLSMEAIGDDKW